MTLLIYLTTEPLSDTVPSTTSTSLDRFVT